MIVLIIALVLSVAVNVYAAYYISQQRKQIAAKELEAETERKSLVEYQKKCYCKDIV